MIIIISCSSVTASEGPHGFVFSLLVLQLLRLLSLSLRLYFEIFSILFFCPPLVLLLAVELWRCILISQVFHPFPSLPTHVVPVFPLVPAAVCPCPPWSTHVPVLFVPSSPLPSFTSSFGPSIFLMIISPFSPVVLPRVSVACRTAFVTVACNVWSSYSLIYYIYCTR